MSNKPEHTTQANTSWLRFENGEETLRAPSGPRFSLTMTGDCCPRGTAALDALRAGRAAEIVAAAQPFIAASDVKLMQLETPFTDESTPIVKSGPNISCPPVALDLVTALDIDTALLANNHIGDHGGAAVLETIRLLNRAGIRTVGAGATPAEANQPLFIETNGLRLALLNVAENEFGTVSERMPGSAPLAPLDNIRAIRAAASNADHVIVVVHGGHERYPLPSPRMVNTYRAFVEAGAAAVINCHTHCPLGIEIWQGAPIVYSPGNFFFPTANYLNAMWWIGYVPKLHFDRKGVYAIETMPFRFDNEKMYELNKADRKSFWSYLAGLNRQIINEKTLQTSFEAWSAQHGTHYLGWLRDRLTTWPRPLDTREALQEMMVVRNLFTCETHHDMLSCYLRLIEEERVAEAETGWARIEQMQTPAWAVRHLTRLQAAETKP